MKTLKFGPVQTGTPFAIVFLYSKTGNMVLKGNIDMIRDYINQNHPRSFYRVTYWQDGKEKFGTWDSPCLCIHRGRYQHVLEGRKHFWLNQPVTISHFNKKYSICTYNPSAPFGKKFGEKKLQLKRIPNKWIPEFDALIDS